MPTHVVCAHCETINRLPEERLSDSPKCGKCRQALFTQHPIELTGQNFARHSERNDIPLLVDFWAPWCGPCRTMAPAFEQATTQLEPRVRLGKLNTETEPEIAGRFNIRSIPTLALLLHGQELGRQSGALNTTGIVHWVDMTLRR